MLTSTQNARKTDDAENKLTYFPDTKTIHNSVQNISETALN